MKLVISLATRGRPERLIESVKISSSNWTNKDTTLYIQVDADDIPTIDAVTKQGWTSLDGNIIANIAPREDTIAAKWNRIMRVPADIYMYHADDDPYTSAGYDQKVIDAAKRFPDGIGAIFGHLANMSFSCTYAATAKYVEKLGFLLPDYFPYWFCDHWTDDLARMIGRISFANISTDQSRPGVTMEMREPAWWATFYDAAYLFRRDQALRILDDPEFETSKWQRELLIAAFPLIDTRSRMINQNVRAQSKQLMQWAGNPAADERYNRTKRAAVAMVPLMLENYGMPEHEKEMFYRGLGVLRQAQAAE